MVPIRLALKNFMPYRDNVPPLSFEGIHVACLTGDNGHGKSAIFDAITWALWGKSRASSDEELIHFGQSDMSVEFDFAVGDQPYRVVRKLSKTPSGRTIPELDLLILGENGYKVISGDSIRATEAIIRGILRMDYDTFINSAFLVQGKYDEFTRKRAGERKEVIGNIMGLSVYDDLARAARDRQSERESEAERLASAVTELERQLQGQAEDESELKIRAPQLDSLKEQLRAQEEAVRKLREAHQSFQMKRHQLDGLRQRLGQERQERREWQSRADQCRSKIGQLEKLLTEAESVAKGYARLVEVRRADQELGRRLTALRALDQRKAELEKAVERAQARLVAAHEEARRRLVELDREISRGPGLQKTLNAKKAELEQLVKEEEEIKPVQDRLRGLADSMVALSSEITRLDGELKAVAEKLDLLSRGDTHCPLCESVLETEGIARLRAKFEAETERLKQQRSESERSLAQKKKDSLALEKALAQKKADIDRMRHVIQKEVASLEKELSDIERSQGEQSRLREELERMEERLARRDYAVEEQKGLFVLEQQRAAVGYDTAEHERVRQELAELEKYQKLQEQVLDATRAINEQKTLLSAAVEAESRLAAAISEDERMEKTLALEVASLADVPANLSAAEKALLRTTDEARELGERVAVLQEKIRRYVELESQKKEKERQRKEAAEEASIYKELAVIFGKKGIQADLIDQAIPEIEEEANLLLGRMTDGRMALKLETQRPKKSAKGEVVETLEIIVADDLGSRSYEMFSGGEAFRINLALRIALSRLLVSRAGASLPVLIIDEGFGTQDTSAREKIIEAIRSIQDEFRKIIVITHLEDLKDAFPVRINVTKTAQGSMIAVS